MNKIKRLLESRAIENFRIEPTRSFFKKIEIGQKRWGQLLRNEKPADLDELKKIAEYFGVEIHELID